MRNVDFTTYYRTACLAGFLTLRTCIRLSFSHWSLFPLQMQPPSPNNLPLVDGHCRWQLSTKNHTKSHWQGSHIFRFMTQHSHRYTSDAIYHNCGVSATGGKTGKVRKRHFEYRASWFYLPQYVLFLHFSAQE